MVTSNSSSSAALRIDVGRTDVWACKNRQPLGHLLLTSPNGIAAVSMRLELLTATLRVNLSHADGSATAVAMFVGAADPKGPTGVLTANASRALAWQWVPDTSGVCANASVAHGTAADGTQWWTQWTPDGTVTSAMAATPSSGGEGQQLVLAVANSQRRGGAAAFASQSEAIAAVAAGAAASTSGALRASHVQWWASFWTGTSFVSFAAPRAGVTALESFTVIAGYRYASAARFTMHDLMGPWGPAHASTCIGPWCQFCWDMNQQVMMLLPTPSNRGALLAVPALDMFDALLNNSWSALYGSNAPGVGVNTLWWLAAMHRYCLFHGDDARLTRSLLPGLRASLQATALSEGADGLLHVPKCTSPEYPMKTATDCAYHLAILRWAAGTALAVATAFAPSDPALALYADIVKRLAPLPVDPLTGSLEIAAGVPFAVPHRHYSHALALYDLGGLADAGTAAATLDTWWSITCSGPQALGPDADGDDECRGFTQAAVSAMSSLLNRSDAALGNLTAYLTLTALPNACYGEEVYAGHPDEFSPVAESAYSAATSVYGLMLTSGSWPAVPQVGSPTAPGFRPTLRVWPAGDALASAAFFRLRGEGALLVSSVREGAAVLWVSLEADVFANDSGEGDPVAPITLACDAWAACAELHVATSAQGPVTATPAGAPGVWVVQGLRRGDAAALYPACSPPPADFVIRLAEGRNASEFNIWGSTFVYKGELP